MTIRFGSKQIKAPLSKVSVTGGVLHLSGKHIQEEFADITIPTAFGPVCSPIEFVRTTVPGQLDAIAFRFFNMDTRDRRKLEQTVEKMLRQGFGDRRDGWFQTLVRRLRSKKPAGMARMTR